MKTAFGRLARERAPVPIAPPVPGCRFPAVIGSSRAVTCGTVLALVRAGEIEDADERRHRHRAALGPVPVPGLCLERAPEPCGRPDAVLQGRRAGTAGGAVGRGR